MTTVIEFDRAGFEAHVLKKDNRIVCILAPAAATDPAIQERVRQLMRSQGIDCRKCCGCPVGTAK
ncbi:hypothetical protein [Streptomyces sp. ME18-1-4]|uniref:hypothetical protein n=1 Tax=Streptomyces sp. ME18-1-4 TaxID=3028685 RepID=UPI0029B13259|nr:hypothetical protein [Streptomyces sp. ME18-1-4]MDX3243482.1 hypothetical protein [Streptomyces sp. ME18-1-4]